MRALAIGGDTGNAVLQALLWIAALLAIFVPLAVSRYRGAAYPYHQSGDAPRRPNPSSCSPNGWSGKRVRPATRKRDEPT